MTIQVKSMKQDGYKDTTELLEKRKYIRSNRIATKYMPTPYWSTFFPCYPPSIDSYLFICI